MIEKMNPPEYPGISAKKDQNQMNRNDPQRLPADLHMPCYACENQPATHVCRYQVGELAVQVCLCDECMKMDTECLLKNTIGIQDIAAPFSNHSMAL